MMLKTTITAHLYEFQQDKKLKARHILVRKILKKAFRYYKRARKFKTQEIQFVELASKYSIDGFKEKRWRYWLVLKG